MKKPVNANVTLASAHDLPDLRRVIHHAHLRTKGLEDCRWLVKAVVNDHIVGAAAIEVLSGHAFFRSFAVERAFRGQHIGSAIWRLCLQLCREADIENMYFITAFYNVPTFEHYGCQIIQLSEFPPEIRTHWQVASPLFKLARRWVRCMQIRVGE